MVSNQLKSNYHHHQGMFLFRCLIVHALAEAYILNPSIRTKNNGNLYWESYFFLFPLIKSPLLTLNWLSYVFLFLWKKLKEFRIEMSAYFHHKFKNPTCFLFKNGELFVRPTPFVCTKVPSIFSSQSHFVIYNYASVSYLLNFPFLDYLQIHFHASLLNMAPRFLFLQLMPISLLHFL